MDGMISRRAVIGSGAAGAALLAGGRAWGTSDPLAPLHVVTTGTKPPQTWPTMSAAALALGQRAVLMAGAPWRGRPTRVFTLIGMPANATGKVPGVVLAHGGGGTAYAEWVKRWTDAGFAAITCALEGQTDVAAPTASTSGGQRWLDNPDGGPARRGIYGDGGEPLGDQWMFHAQWAVAAAHSLLASMPGVDAARIGICGISWGGVITSTAIGIDRRPAFAIPIYGCGFLSEMTNQYEAASRFPSYAQVWEPGLRFDRARMPSLWLTDLPDKHFSLIQQAKSYAKVAGPHMVSIKPDMTHNHPQGWNAPESYAFAKSVVKAGFPWANQTAGGRSGLAASARFHTDRTIERAVIYTTADRGHSTDRKWTAAPANLTAKGGDVTAGASVPGGTTAWFFNLHAGDLVLSSDLGTSGPQ